MPSLIHSEMFFFISSIGFVVIGIIGVVLLVLCIRATSSLLRILEKVESSMDSIGDATMDLIEDMRHNAIFRLLFGSRKKQNPRLNKKG